MEAAIGPMSEGDLLALAASGDVVALKEMALLCASQQHYGVHPLEAMVGAEAFARLAAAQGGSDEEALLAAVLRVRAGHVASLGDFERALRLLDQSEALCDDFHDLRLGRGVEFLAGLLTVEADEGHELSARKLDKLTAALPPADAVGLCRAVSDALRSFHLKNPLFLPPIAEPEVPGAASVPQTATPDAAQQ